jgi:hypothetical protein
MCDDLQSMSLVLQGLDTPERVEFLYMKLRASFESGCRSSIALDLSPVSFVYPDGLLAIANAARLWHRWTGTRVVLMGMQPQIHKYLERMDLFTVCRNWLYPDPALRLMDPYDRSPASTRLLEVMPISGEEKRNSSDVTEAVTRVQKILSAWLPADATAVGYLCLILSEIAHNIVHSHDQGFAVIQRYQDSTMGPMGSRVVIAVADLGLGIEATLRAKSRPHGPVKDQASWSGSDYIRYALTHGVSSPDRLRGTGLTQVKSIVGRWSGSMVVRSFRSRVGFEPEGFNERDNLPEIPGTQVTITVRGSWLTDIPF